MIARTWVQTLVMALVMLGLAAGCVSKKGPRSFEGQKLPMTGGPVSQQLYVTLEDDRSATRTVGEVHRSFIWPVPLHLVSRDLKIHTFRSPLADPSGTPRANTATNEVMLWNDLLGPVFLTTLPVRVYNRHILIDRGADEPAARTGVVFTPFWSKGWSEGEVERLPRNFSGWGVPLIYSHLRMSGPPSASGDASEFRVDLHSSLWSLGPMMLRMRAETPESSERAYFATPLFLGGALGTILWSDYLLRSEPASIDPRDSFRIMGHGPLGGLLGYMAYREPFLMKDDMRVPPDVQPPVGAVPHVQRARLALAGVLWSSTSLRELETQRTVRSAHGPLWTAFGYGVRRDRMAIRVFWIPLRVGPKMSGSDDE